MTRTRERLVIVGSGGLARAMAKALASAPRLAVTVVTRRAASARSFPATIAAADLVLLAVPDRAIAPVARAIAPMRSAWRGVVAFHAAGAFGPELLVALRRRGAATGVLHPLAVLGASHTVSLDGAFARIEGGTRALAAARRLCAASGLTPLRGAGLSGTRGRRRYHAAASLASNDVVALLAAAHDLLVRAGVRRREALAAVTELARRAVAAVKEAGPAEGLTGPVVRNDADTLVAQLALLEADDPEAALAHRALSLRLVALAVAGKRLDRAAARDLSALLARGPGRIRGV